MPDRKPPTRTRPARATKAPDPAEPGRYHTDTGTVELLTDQNDSRGRILVLNGVPSSYVHLDDPTRLEYEYVRWLGDLIDEFAEPQAALRVTHLGGAGCTLPRYVSATRPGSRQVVFEHDRALADLAREAFDLRRERNLRIRVTEARAGLATLRERSQHLVIRDAFTGDQVPEHLTTMEFLHEVARVLAPGGIYAANVADRTTTVEARKEAKTLLAVFEHVAMVAEPAQLRGRRYGNVIVFAAHQELPVDALTRRLASGPVRARLLPTERVAELAAGQRLRTDPAGPGADGSEPWEPTPTGFIPGVTG